MVDINLICFLSFPLANKSDILQQHQHWKLILFLQVPPAGSNGGSGSESSEERRKKVARHISIDETPITHTYHQNSLETSSQSSNSPSEVTSFSNSEDKLEARGHCMISDRVWDIFRFVGMRQPAELKFEWKVEGRRRRR